MLLIYVYMCIYIYVYTHILSILCQHMIYIYIHTYMYSHTYLPIVTIYSHTSTHNGRIYRVGNPIEKHQQLALRVQHLLPLHRLKGKITEDLRIPR